VLSNYLRGDKMKKMCLLMIPIVVIIIFSTIMVAAEECATTDGACIKLISTIKTLNVGDEYEIKWIQTGLTKILIMYEGYDNSGLGYVMNPTDVSSNRSQQSYVWKIPSNVGGKKIRLAFEGYTSDNAKPKFSSDYFNVIGDCVDSDNGKDYYTKGTITGNEMYTQQDGCYETLLCPTDQECLQEYYCDELKARKSEYYECPKGCFDGKCKTCTSECASVGTKECSGNGYRICEEKNNEGCNEWSQITACSNGCSYGECGAIYEGSEKTCTSSTRYYPHLGIAFGEDTSTSLSLDNEGSNIYTIKISKYPSDPNTKIIIRLTNSAGQTDQKIVNNGERAEFFDCSVWVIASRLGNGVITLSGGYAKEGFERELSQFYTELFIHDYVDIDFDTKLEVTEIKSGTYPNCQCQIKVTHDSQSETAWVPLQATIDVMNLNIEDSSTCGSSTHQDAVLCRLKIQKEAECTNECSTVGTKSCFGEGYKSCQIDSIGCLKWSSFVACQTGCQDGKCTMPSTDSAVTPTNGAPTPTAPSPISPSVKDECTSATECDDGDPSTGDSCDLLRKKCVSSVKITQCFGGDNYCPQNCIYSQDSDCDECQTNNDCDEKDACSIKSCEGLPRRCSYQVQSGCSINGSCAPIGTRTDNEYCDLSSKLVNQGTKDNGCNNNYECISNLCVDSKCIQPGLFRKFMMWFSNLFG
jgi:hypothetical protein